MIPNVTTAALATKHGKEDIFRPAFATLGIEVRVVDVDTDRFGTFAGEIERVGSPMEIAEAKARAGIAASGSRIGLASEGSFHPHPASPYLLTNSEVVVYVDSELGYSVFDHAREISKVPTSASVAEVASVDALAINRAFPQQRAIVVAIDPETGARRVIAKGIDSSDELRRTIELALNECTHPVIVEPDLRAHHCPDRRTVISTAVERLVQRLGTECPTCTAPGFGRIRTIPGLRCGLCELPTTLPMADVLGCARCGSEEHVTRSGAADPTYCDRCNP